MCVFAIEKRATCSSSSSTTVRAVGRPSRSYSGMSRCVSYRHSSMLFQSPMLECDTFKRNVETCMVYAGAPGSEPEESEQDMQMWMDEEEFVEIFDQSNQIPGNYKDAMSSKTELGAAIRDACGELDALGSLEQSVLEEAEGLLKQIGYKGSLFDGAKSTDE